jgi:hypothetical protein
MQALTPTLNTVATLPRIPMLPAVATLPATATPPAVATLPATATLPAVATLPATATLPAVAALPATATRPAVTTLPATATESSASVPSTVELQRAPSLRVAPYGHPGQNAGTLGGQRATISPAHEESRGEQEILASPLQ